MVKDGNSLRLDSVCDVGDQGIEARSTLSFEDGGDRDGVSRVSGKAIDGLSGQNDKSAGGESLGGLDVGRTRSSRA